MATPNLDRLCDLIEEVHDRQDEFQQTFEQHHQDLMDELSKFKFVVVCIMAAIFISRLIDLFVR